MKYKILSLVLLLCGVSAAFFFLKNKQRPLLYSELPKDFGIEYDPSESLKMEEEGDEASENPEERLQYELSQLVDPETGVLPADIREKELAFALKIAETENLSPAGAAAGGEFATATAPISPFTSAGPYNVGGRTRAVAIDKANENIILAGGVSGGVWKTTDQGASWKRTTSLIQHPAITDIVQDRRNSKTNEWYYSTGELTGNSASLPGSFYQGNGIYKSTNNGDSWTLLKPTAVSGTSGTDVITRIGRFTLIDDLAIDFSNNAGTEIYAAGASRIVRSTDGFKTFNTVLGAKNNQYANQCAVAVTSKGKVFATIGKSRSNGNSPDVEEGVFMSDDGQTWKNIDPPTLNTRFPRMAIGIDASNEDHLYFVTDKQLFSFNDRTDKWTELTANLRESKDVGEGFHAQRGYNLMVAVHPDPNIKDTIVYVGGTNLLRSVKGFTNDEATHQIGGYKPDGIPISHPLYPNHHPDLHATVFFDADPDKMLSGSDGGVHITQNNRAKNALTPKTPVTWKSLNNGYLTSQFYHASIHNYDIGEPRIIGGLQDNGSWYTFKGKKEPWQQVFGGDGAYSGITYNSMFVSAQKGILYRYFLNTEKKWTATTISPAKTGKDSDFLFINPFIYNPVQQDQLVVGAKGKLFITNDVRENPREGDWLELSGPAGFNDYVSALAFSTQTEGVLYFGTRNGGLFKINNTKRANKNTKITALNTRKMPSGNVSGIAVDPLNANRVFVAFSNYNVVSLWMSENGGASWSSISGTLEENADGSGAGPSVRAIAVMPDGNGGHYYFAGTSVGLFMTKELNGDRTVWTQQAKNSIGNIVIGNISLRPVEGVVIVSTHANGVFKGKYAVGVNPHIHYAFLENKKKAVLKGNLSFDAKNRLAYRWFKDGKIFAPWKDIKREITVSQSGKYQLELATEATNLKIIAKSNIINLVLGNIAEPKPPSSDGISLSTPLLAFDETGIHKKSKLTFSIFNNRSTPLEVRNITYPPGFTGSWSSGAILANDSQPVEVTFSPTEVKNYSGTIVVTSNATASAPKAWQAGGTGTSGKNTLQVTGKGILVTGIEPNEVFAGLSIFPNPAKDVLHIKLPNQTKPVNIQLIDANGKPVYESKSTVGNQLSLDVSGYKSGVYVLVLRGGGSKVVKRKIVIRR